MRRSAAPSQLGSLKRPREPEKFGSNVVRSDEEVMKLLHRQTRKSPANKETGPAPPKKTFAAPTQTLNERRDPLLEESNSEERFFNVVWAKMSKKKHKTWEGDAVLVMRGRSVRLIDIDGKDIGRGSGYSSAQLDEWCQGGSLVVAGKEVEMISNLSAEAFKSGRCFHDDDHAVPTGAVKPGLLSRPVLKGFKPVKRPAHTQSFETGPEAGGKPLFDPEAPNAVLLTRPPSAHMLRHNSGGLPVVDVVVDPYVGKHLRPHQREGLLFLYECVLGFRLKGYGAILADSMGLGKTLQCIALLWTLLRQGPYGGKPVVRRCLIVTPGSLVKNWQREFSKWLGEHRLPVFFGGADRRVEEYVRVPTQQVLVLSYEMFMRHSESLQTLTFDLLICDEGHRLKNLDSKTASVLHSLPTKRRIILSGTPLQNDMEELFSLAEFCNPGVFGSMVTFRRVYADAIVAARQPGANRETLELGECRSRELGRLISMFVLRRTQEVNTKYLPPKVESVLFCRPSQLQLELYRKVLRSQAVKACLQEAYGGSFCSGGDHLACITILKKVCNDPSLLWRKMTSSEEDRLWADLRTSFPEDFDPDSMEELHSGKLWVVGQMLSVLSGRARTEKIVLVSNYTKTLDLLQRLCAFLELSWLRLDGKTPTSQRLKIVERFNARDAGDRVLLLSSKAGGTGLNLVGAAHLVLFDVDWNPAHEVQAMARVWRDGQRRKVHVYRLLTTGCIDEKIYQRQVTKQGLSGQVVDSRARGVAFSVEELKDLFRLHEDTACLTHDLLKCNCSQDSKWEEPEAEEKERPAQLGTASESILKSRVLDIGELRTWRHLQPGGHAWTEEVVDPLILAAEENVSFLFQHEVSTAEESQC